ncbi:PLD nuclease N-terminal domain-containing protein [Leptothoe sp. ISB3NOV94-8A]
MTTWEYDQLIQAIEQDKIERIDIYSHPHYFQATVETLEGERIAVRLPDDPKLSDGPQLQEILIQKKIDASMQPYRNERLALIRTVAILMSPVVVALFWLWVLIDCATQEASEGNTKIVWTIIILFLNFVGALIYVFVRRPQRRRELAQ